MAYTASSVPAQKLCIEAALEKAGVSADEIGYVECHGTATKIGDPLEVKSVVQAFRASLSGKSHCAIGSVKSNIGHLEQAASTGGSKPVLDGARYIYKGLRLERFCSQDIKGLTKCACPSRIVDSYIDIPSRYLTELLTRLKVIDLLNLSAGECHVELLQ